MSFARDFLEKRPWFLNLWAVTAAFSSYFSMYMFRKPFTAASYDHPAPGISTEPSVVSTEMLSAAATTTWDEKSVLVASQVFGYMISKFIGVRVISSLEAGKRATAFLSLLAVSHLALLLFAILPAPYHIGAIFLNGLPLGMVFGLVLGFLEGRRMTEALTAGLCASFILAGGFSKTLGSWVLQYLTESLAWDPAVAERWMPFVAGLVFVAPLTLSVWMLAQIPPPAQQDVQARSRRVPMSSKDRYDLLRNYGFGIGTVAVAFFLTTILRSIRDDFAPEIFRGLGADVSATDYTRIDLIVASIVLVVNGLSVIVIENRRALMISLGICLTGFVLIPISFLLVDSAKISASGFMILLGAGLYLPYVAIHTTVFERMIALVRDRSNLAFLIYVVDSLGYLGYVGIMLLRNLLPSTEGGRAADLLLAFRWTCWVSALVSILSIVLAIGYFWRLKAGSATAQSLPLETEVAGRSA